MQANLLLYSHLADIELIHKVKAGRVECLETLVRRHNKTLYRIGRAFGLSGAAIEEVVAGIYTDIYTLLQTYDLRHSYRCWISEKMVAACKRFAGTAADELLMDDSNVLTVPAVAAGSALEDRLAVLPLEERVALVLCEIEGFSEKEAAEISGATRPEIELQLRKARMEMGDQLMSWYFSTEVYNCPAGCSDAITDRVMMALA